MLTMRTLVREDVLVATGPEVLETMLTGSADIGFPLEQLVCQSTSVHRCDDRSSRHPGVIRQRWNNLHNLGFYWIGSCTIQCDDTNGDGDVGGGNANDWVIRLIS